MISEESQSITPQHCSLGGKAMLAGSRKGMNVENLAHSLPLSSAKLANLFHSFHRTFHTPKRVIESLFVLILMPYICPIQSKYMKLRIKLYILLVLFFAISGRVEMRAGELALAGDTCNMEQRLTQPQTWAKICRWVEDDPQVPDREEVITLIRYHFGNFEKLTALLRYLDRGRPYAYLTEHIFPKFEREKIVKRTLSISKLSLPGRHLPEKRITPVVAYAPLPTGEQAERKRATTVLALKNNLLYDLALAPNVEVELPLGRRWSLNAEFKCPWWSHTRKGFCYQLLSGGLEVRYRPGRREQRELLTGHFVGLYAEGGDYDFQTSTTRGYQGDYYAAAGITYGYTRRIARSLALEFSLGVGYLLTDYRKYTTYEGDLIWQTSGRYHFLGPTKAKISLVWLLNGGGRRR